MLWLLTILALAYAFTGGLFKTRDPDFTPPARRVGQS